MNIVSVKESPGHNKYQLDENGTTVLKLNHNLDSHTLRIQAGTLQRALILEDEGILKPRWVLKNEYGVKIGHLVYDNFTHHHGSFEIDGYRFRFNLQNAAENELRIYKSSEKNLLYTCSMSSDVADKRSDINFNCPLIFAVSWYLFTRNVSRENLSYSA